MGPFVRKGDVSSIGNGADRNGLFPPLQFPCRVQALMCRQMEYLHELNDTGSTQARPAFAAHPMCQQAARVFTLFFLRQRWSGASFRHYFKAVMGHMRFFGTLGAPFASA